MRNRTRWGIAAAVTATLIVFGGMYLNATGTTPAGPTIDPLARFQHQPIAWHDCQLGENDEDGKELDDAHAECADVTVPLDYSHPDRRTTTVAISRVKATDTGHRIGIMIFNLGGPALPVLTEVVDVRKEMGEAGARFDLIGMDPRFTNRSTPLDCGLPNNWLSLSAGADRQGFDRSLLRAQDVATRCLQEYGDVLPYASTAHTARDMDVIRSALGEAKLSYLGYSYGSYLGAVYTQLFGPHADRIVLDSALDPAGPGTLPRVNTGMVGEAGLRDWAAWAAQHDATYHLGATPAAVLSTVDRIYRPRPGNRCALALISRRQRVGRRDPRFAQLRQGQRQPRPRRYCGGLQPGRHHGQPAADPRPTRPGSGPHSEALADRRQLEHAQRTGSDHVR